MLLFAFCAIPMPAAQEPARQLEQFSVSGPLFAGAARVRIDLPDEPVLSGYAGLRRARSASAPVYARAIVVESGGRRATLASVDTLLIPPGFGLPPGCALVAATHTHTGPGGLWDSWLAGLIGAGAPSAQQRAQVERALLEAVAQAARALGPVELSMGREAWPSGPAKARSDGPIDPDLVALRLRRPAGAAVATVVVYAMHPTSAPHDVLSGDWPGELDGDTAPTLVLQGAVGNTTWPRDRPLAPPIAAAVEKLLEGAPPLSEAPLSCATRTVATPPLQASRKVPWPLRTAFANLLSLGLRTDATQTRLRIGPLELLGVPGEPVGELGLKARPVVLVGLAGGYLGYVEAPARWLSAGGES